MNDQQECHVEPVEKAIDREALSKAVVAYLSITGMGCSRCAMRVRNALLNQDGTLLVDVYLQQKYAAAAYDPRFTNPEELVKAVEGAGNDGKHHYGAELLTQVPALQALSW